MAANNLNRKAVALAAGEAHTLLLTGDGDVYSWGRGTFGRLGNGSEVDHHFPLKIELGKKIVGLAAGAYHSLALSDDGSLWSWGYNSYGQLGFDGGSSSVPSLVKVPVTNGSATNNETTLKMSSVKAGGMMSLAIDEHGSLWMWGNCPVPEISSEVEFTLAPIPTPTPVNFHGHTVVKVACGSEHIVALVNAGAIRENGDLVCYTWGNNDHGQLGVGDTDTRPNPEIVQKFNTGAGSPWAAYEVACGAFHTCVLAYKKTDNVVLENACWTFGRGNNGQLGQGTSKNSLYPQMVDGLPKNLNLVSVDCGLFHTSVVSSSGSVWSWGMENGLGLCPEATFTEGDGGDALSPRLINGPKFSDPVQVACGAAHTVILADNGYKLWSWGRGKSGVLGTGQEVDFFKPTPVLWPPPNEDGQETVTKSVLEKGSEESTEIEKRLAVMMEEMNLLQSKFYIMERYASILHGSIFGKPFEEDKDIPLSLRTSGTFDINKEWENMLESCDRSKLIRLQMFYRNMLAGVDDKMMNLRIKEMLKEYLESSPRNNR
ncbi:ultraviolet-B receptor UVR8-like isoform X2 [Rutidosis leptorrhynchoides]|uniref:ultraviolet-B receptor UVR8-like isoform X2 n=1 Tax=Rutidosis leptorrhynchoides TaxID=125765 RepID=UPI003A9A6344